jgi:hypothetical protein
LKGSSPVYCEGREVSSEEKDVAGIKYVSKVKVEPVEGKVRRAYLPVQDDPVFFGVHDEVAEHYGVSPEDVEPYDATLDYVVAAVGG